MAGHQARCRHYPDTCLAFVLCPRISSSGSLNHKPAVGRAPIPYGNISVKWGVRSNRTFAMNVFVPNGTSGTIAVPVTGDAQSRSTEEWSQPHRLPCWTRRPRAAMASAIVISTASLPARTKWRSEADGRPAAVKVMGHSDPLSAPAHCWSVWSALNLRFEG